MPSPEQIEAAVEAYVAAYNSDDREAFLAVWADDGVLEDPVGTPVHEGRDALGSFWDGVHELSPQIRLFPSHVHVAGDEAAMVFEIRTSAVVIDVVDILRVDDEGKLASVRAFWDLAKARPVE